MIVIHHRNSDDHGFTLLELVVTIAILTLLLALSMPALLGARRHARNNAMRETAQHVARALVAYNHDYPVITPQNVWPPASTSCASLGDCWDPLMRRNGSARYPSRSWTGGTTRVWSDDGTGDDWKDPNRGITDRHARPYLGDWPESPFTGAHVHIVRGGGGEADRPGLIRVDRGTGTPFGAPLGSFRVAAFGLAVDGGVAPVYRRTMGGPADPSWDCGYPNAMACPGS